jgi:hypothetical protein
VTTGALAVLLAVALPLAAAFVWGTFAAPKARVRLATALKVAVRSAVLLGAALALAEADRVALAIAFAAVIAVDTAVLIVLREPVAGA